jgi:hypothetical protein
VAVEADMMGVFCKKFGIKMEMLPVPTQAGKLLMIQDILQIILLDYETTSR